MSKAIEVDDDCPVGLVATCYIGMYLPTGRKQLVILNYYESQNKAQNALFIGSD